MSPTKLEITHDYFVECLEHTFELGYLKGLIDSYQLPTVISLKTIKDLYGETTAKIARNDKTLQWFAKCSGTDKSGYITNRFQFEKWLYRNQFSKHSQPRLVEPKIKKA